MSELLTQMLSFSFWIYINPVSVVAAYFSSFFEINFITTFMKIV